MDDNNLTFKNSTIPTKNQESIGRYPSTSQSTSAVNEYVGVEEIHSNLQPTAAEFQPSYSNNGGARRREVQRSSYDKPTKDQKSYGRNFNKTRQYQKKWVKPNVQYDYQQNNRESYVNSSSYKPNRDYQRRYGETFSENNEEFSSSNDFENFPKNQYYRNSFHNNISREKYRGNKYGNNNYETFSKPQVSRKYNSFNNKSLRYDSHSSQGANTSSYENKYKTSDKSNVNNYSAHFDYSSGNHESQEPKNNYASANSTNEYFTNCGTSTRRNFKENDNRNSLRKGKYLRNNSRNERVNAASQKERLEEMIYSGILECLVCCEKIKNNDKVWSCQLCYHILHLHCVGAWAKTSKIEKGWRCPACQNVYNEIPKDYKCYCGKHLEPTSSSGVIPHGCGEICLRKGRTCEHRCTLLCHPGPCPDCNVMVSKPCGCGATSRVVKCNTAVEILCDNICDKLLECGLHRCKQKCHSDVCNPCTQILRQECYCGKIGRKVLCKRKYAGSTRYECGEVCGKRLSCGNHFCSKLCHDGPCQGCPTDVENICTCPCGKKLLDKKRGTCLDPIPCCDQTCEKQLPCGPPGFRHTCSAHCHEGACPPCPLRTVVKCRCGHTDKEVPCQKLPDNPGDMKCEKKCTKKRLCGKHKCNQRCCIQIDHVCPLPCNHMLSCGQHRCERTCHSGRCPPCIEASFEELYCECGASVIYPPVPCGTKPPACNKPCSRPRSCEHDANHNCHTGSCPPCTVLCKKWCFGHHEQRSAILCHQNNFSCGMPCGKEMSCGRHKCIKPCHEGPCPSVCTQPCTTLRRLCGHICGKPCHGGACPESNCKEKVAVTCLCGLQKSTKPCIDVMEEFKNLEMAQLKEKIATSSADQAVDISDIVNNPVRPNVFKILDCNDECRIIERNRRLAIGLQIINPDLSQKLLPKYSDFMRQWAKKDAHFCQRVHDKLTDLVQLAKQSKQKSRSYSFDSMNKDKRHFIHEYCEHFGIESAAYDSEPNRNVVATAIKDKSWLPSMSLLEVIQRENGQRKVPGPMQMTTRNSVGKSESSYSKLPGRLQTPISQFN